MSAGLASLRHISFNNEPSLIFYLLTAYILDSWIADLPGGMRNVVMYQLRRR